jgi:hypothetical protein
MKSILLAVLILLSVCAFGQVKNEDSWGIHFGVGSTNSMISGLDKMLVSDPRYKGYSFEKDKYRWSNWDFNFGLQYEAKAPDKFEKLLVCWLPEVGISLATAQFKDKPIHRDLTYQDSLGLKYEMNYNYDYFIINPLSGRFGFKKRGNDKAEKWDWAAFLELSMPYHINISNTNLTYTSNVKNNAEEDLVVESELKKYLIGSNYFSFRFGAGGMLHFGENIALTLRGSRTLGFRDVIDTQANAHGFINNTNKRTTWNGSIGIAIYFY